MPQYQVFRPKEPGASRTAAEIFSGTSDQLEALKKPGGGTSDLSYTLVPDTQASPGAAAGGSSPGFGGTEEQPGGAVVSPTPPEKSSTATGAMLGLEAQQPQPGVPVQPLYGANALRPNLGTRTPPPLAGLLQYKVY